MVTRNVNIAQGEFYHLYNRGVDKRTIFENESQWNHFVELLFLSNSIQRIDTRLIKNNYNSIFEFDRGATLVDIGGYCLMPNHFHVMIKVKAEAGVGIFMNKLCTAYSMYFNKLNKRSGALFQGNYRISHVNTDQYLKYLYAYIPLNPIKLIDSTWKEQGIKDSLNALEFASNFRYSSLPDYLGHLRLESAILNSSAFPEYFSRPSEHKTELLEWLTAYGPLPANKSS